MPVTHQLTPRGRTSTLRSCVAAPRWAGFASAIRQACWQLGLDCKLQEDKTLLRTTVYFDVTGSAADVLTFAKWINQTVTG